MSMACCVPGSSSAGGGAVCYRWWCRGYSGVPCGAKPPLRPRRARLGTPRRAQERERSSVPAHHQIVHGPVGAALRVAGGVANGDERVREERRIEVQRGANGGGGEERGAHPAGIQAERIGGEEHILNGGAQALDRHDFFGALAAGIGIAVEIFEIEAGEDERGGGADALVGLRETGGDDLWRLAVHLQRALPVGAHRFRQSRLRVGCREDGETPRLASVWRGRPARGLQHCCQRGTRHGALLKGANSAPVSRQRHEVQPAPRLRPYARGGGAVGERRSPGDDAVRGDRDDEPLLQRHRLVLWVAFTEQAKRGGVVRGAGREQGRLSAYLDEAEPRPVVVVAIYQEGHGGVRRDVAHAAQRGGGKALGLLVQWRNEASAIVGVADRHDGRLAAGIYRGEARGALGENEGSFTLRQCHPLAHHWSPVSRWW